MDWRAYHSINDFVWRHHWLGSLFKAIETYGTILIAVAAFALWFLARPGGDRQQSTSRQVIPCLTGRST